MHITRIQYNWLRFDDLTMFTQPLYDFFVKLANYGNDIFGTMNQLPHWLRP